ncbi:MAG: hypothetical protein ACI85I_001190, partial [Arenicella sp.]
GFFCLQAGVYIPTLLSNETNSKRLKVFLKFFNIILLRK